MTKEAAISVIQNSIKCIKASCCYYPQCSTCTLSMDAKTVLAAYDMAIEALEEPDRKTEHSLWFRIGETLVSESKGHISAERAIDKIRQYMQEADLNGVSPKN